MISDFQIIESGTEYQLIIMNHSEFNTEEPEEGTDSVSLCVCVIIAVICFIRDEYKVKSSIVYKTKLFYLKSRDI